MTSDANVTVSIDSSAVDAYLEKYDRAMDGKSPDDLRQEIGGIEQQAKDVGSEIKSSDRQLKRLLTQVPGLREVMRGYRAFSQFQSGALPLAGMTALLLYSQILQQIDQYLAKIDQEKREMEVLIRETRGLDSRVEYERWRSDQQNNIASTRNIR